MKYDVVIVGGGLAGLSLAAALRQSSLRIALVESVPPRQPEGWDTRIYAISPANRSFLAGLGIWGRLDPARMAQVEFMDIFGDGPGRLQFSAYDAGIESLAWIVEASAMQHALWESLRHQANLSLYCPARPVNLVPGEAGYVLTLEDGRVLHSDLLVAADGVESWIRRAANIQARFRDYDQLGLVANFECSQSHHGTACQWFRHDGVLAWLPLPGNRISIVWSTYRQHAHELLGLSADQLADCVAQAGLRRFGPLRLLTPAQAFPLRWMRAESVAFPGLALIGDAAHAVHPLSGHGINLGYRDAEVLAALLRDKSRHVRCGSLDLLRRYERARKEEVVMVQTLTDSLQRMFSSDWRLLSALRNFGMNLTNTAPVIKDLLVRYAIAS